MKTYNARKRAKVNPSAAAAFFTDQNDKSVLSSAQRSQSAPVKDPYSFDVEEPEKRGHLDPSFLAQLASTFNQVPVSPGKHDSGSEGSFREGGSPAPTGFPSAQASPPSETQNSDASGSGRPTKLKREDISSPPSSSDSKQSSDPAHAHSPTRISLGSPTSKHSQAPNSTATLPSTSEGPVLPQGRSGWPFNPSQPESTSSTTHMAPSVTKPQHEGPPVTLQPPFQPVQNGAQLKRAPVPPTGARPTRSAPAALPPHNADGELQDSTGASHRSGSASQPTEEPSGGAGLMPPPPPRAVRGSGGSASGVGQVSRFGRAAGNGTASEAAPLPARVALAGRGGRSQAVKGGLARALCNKLAAARPAKGPTVSEAQESGEQCHILDNVVYALDGVRSGRSSTRRDSAATLAELCASRRARIAIRSDGLFKEMVSAAAAPPGANDSVVCLAFASLLLAFSQDEAHRGLLASPASAALLLNLLQAEEVGSADADTDASVARLLKLLRGPLGKGLPRVETCSPSSVALLALTRATDPQQSSAGMEALKEALLENGVLEQVACLAALRGDALPSLEQDASANAGQSLDFPGAASANPAERCLWSLTRALLALENASFACPANEGHLTGLQLPGPAGEEGAEGSRSLTACLVEQAGFLAQERAGLTAVARRACLHAVLSVLMNMTHAQERGCSALVDAGGLRTIASLLQSALGADTDNPSMDRDAVLDQMDILSVALGVLINVAENGREWRRHLADVVLSTNLVEEQRAVDLLSLLCRLVKAGGAGAEADSLRRRNSTGGVEVTEAALRQGEEDGNVAIVEAYAALLLGFLVEGDAVACQAAAVQLPGGNLQGVASAVERCLHFYVDAGAITARTESSLRRLLASLKVS